MLASGKPEPLREAVEIVDEPREDPVDVHFGVARLNQDSRGTRSAGPSIARTPAPSPSPAHTTPPTAIAIASAAGVFTQMFRRTETSDQTGHDGGSKARTTGHARAASATHGELARNRTRRANLKSLHRRHVWTTCRAARTLMLHATVDSDAHRSRRHGRIADPKGRSRPVRDLAQSWTRGMKIGTS